MNFKLIFLATVLFGLFNPSFANSLEKNYFQFEVADYQTARQSGQTVNIYVRYAYNDNLAPSKYPDYRELRKSVLKYMEPTEQLPANVYWEILATTIGQDLIKNYPIKAVSIQLGVLDNPEGGEPGNHGPIYTYGEMTPLSFKK